MTARRCLSNQSVMNDPSPSAGWFEARQHCLPVRIYYEDTDFTGVVYHANFLRYFERGRSDFMRLAGISHSDLLAPPEPLGMAITRMEIDFVKAARIDDALLVRTGVVAVKGPRFVFAQAALRAGEEVARARVEACCITMTGAPKRPPKALVEAMSRYLAPGASTF